MIQRLCKECGNSYYQYNSAQTLCGRCQYNKYAKPRKPINRVGKVAKKWIETRKQWIDEHPGPWSCYICGTPLNIDTLTLDHVKSRSRRPDLRYEFDNLQPCCWPCNTAKGSNSL